MKKRRILILFAAVVLSAGFFLYHRLRSVRAPEFVLSYAENQTEDYPTTLGAKKFAELVERESSGRIKILVQAEGELGAESGVIAQMQYGGIDFARVSLSQLAEYIPELNVLQMPYLYSDSDHMWKVLDGRIGSDFLEKVSKSELIGLSWYDAGARNFYNSKKPITCLEDMAGMRIRVQESEVMVDMVEALGATALPIPYADVYSTLERGTVDGAENNWPSYEAMNHYEVAKYYTVDEHNRVPEMQICSKHTWNKLSEDDRQMILECAKESALYERKLWKEREADSKEIALKQGVEVVELSAAEKKRFQEAVMGVYEKYCADYMDVIEQIIDTGKVPLIVDPDGASITALKPDVVVDAILAKKNFGTNRSMAPLTVGLGPGFTAGVDVDIVIETMRGHNLGRIIREGSAIPNTGIPGNIGGYTAERVIHAGAEGILYNVHKIGDIVEQGEEIAYIADEKENRRYSVTATIPGIIRGLIRDGYPATKGFKIADIDPRKSELSNCFTISDKARCIAGSVLEVVCAFGSNILS